jgi:hypothetical protein
MNWRLKVVLHWIISATPFNHQLQFALQRLNGSFPISDHALQKTVDNARRHAAALGTPQAGILYEFGAGWDLANALAMWGLGYRQQVLVDLRPLARLSLVNDVASRLQQRGLPSIQPLRSLDELADYGIKYLAPADARCAELLTGSVRHIVTTDTLEHIPAPQIAAILRECHRVLTADGLVSMIIDYQDHWSYADPSLDRFNFLRYGHRTWQFLNPPTHWQNRLRHKDYIALFEQAGFQIVACEVSPEEIGSHIVARKSLTDASH